MALPYDDPRLRLRRQRATEFAVAILSHPTVEFTTSNFHSLCTSAALMAWRMEMEEIVVNGHAEYPATAMEAKELLK